MTGGAWPGDAGREGEGETAAREPGSSSEEEDDAASAAGSCMTAAKPVPRRSRRRRRSRVLELELSAEFPPRDGRAPPSPAR